MISVGCWLLACQVTGSKSKDDAGSPAATAADDLTDAATTRPTSAFEDGGESPERAADASWPTTSDASPEPDLAPADGGASLDASTLPPQPPDIDPEDAGHAASGDDVDLEGGADPVDADAPSVAVPCPELPEFVEPSRLSETGLYADMQSGELAAGVYEYAPRYELWSDSAVKRRFVYLPPCSQIDTADMDFWTYPPGTKLWKEFVRENEQGQPVRVETRLLQKYSATKWFMTAFIWTEDESDALVGPADNQDSYVLSENARGTPHDVPGRGACFECHGGMRDKVLGLSALQLSHPAPDGFMTLERLRDEGWLTEAPAAALVLPGEERAAEALGYLHANCGHCHNPNSKQASLGLELWARHTGLASMDQTSAVATSLGESTQSPQKPAGEPELRLVPGSPQDSALYWRMIQPPEYPALPQGGVHMPLIGSELTDDNGVALVADWIESLD